MKVLAAARHPGPAEAVGMVVAELRGQGHDVLLIGVRNDTMDTKVHGGSAHIFQRLGLTFLDLIDAGYIGDVVNIPITFADSLIESYRPDVIFVGCSLDVNGEHMGIEETLVQAGANRSIKTVQMVEYWDVWYPRLEPSFASKYTALDDLTRAVLEARGVPADRIAITGHPGLDVYAEATEAPRTERRQALGISDERVLGYFGQAADSDGNPDNPRTLRWAMEILQPNDRLAFSQHPRDDRDYFSILNGADGRLIVAPWTGDQFLSLVDVCVTHYSMMGLKSALLNIPTINILLEDDCADVRSVCGGFPLSILGGSQAAHSSDELREVLARPPESSASRLKAALRVDGKATHRVAETVTAS